MKILMEILKSLIFPIVIGILSMYIASRFEQRKTRISEEKVRSEQLNKLESNYYMMLSHANALNQYVHNSVMDLSAIRLEVENIQKLLKEVNIDILPKELKRYCGYFIHSFEKRVFEINQLLDGNAESFEFEREQLERQLYSSSMLFQNHYLRYLEESLGIAK